MSSLRVATGQSARTRPNPYASEHPERAAGPDAAFERAEVIDVQEAQIGHQIMQELKPALEYFGF